MRFDAHSQTTRDGEYHERTYHGEIDAFVVRYPANERLYWIDVENPTSGEMELRFEAVIDHPSIKWAAEYEFDGTIPEATRPARQEAVMCPPVTNYLVRGARLRGIGRDRSPPRGRPAGEQCARFENP